MLPDPQSSSPKNDMEKKTMAAADSQPDRPPGHRLHRLVPQVIQRLHRGVDAVVMRTPSPPRSMASQTVRATPDVRYSRTVENATVGMSLRSNHAAACVIMSAWSS